MPGFSELGGMILDSKLSASFISDFAEKNNIDLSDYEPKAYRSFNDFFTRKIKPGSRPIPKDKNILISPSDGKVTAYKIDEVNGFVIKNSVYSVRSLLRDKKLAKRYEGGTAVIIRLTPDDYHRYCYAATGIKSHDRIINGVLSTVNPVVNEYVPVYRENSRRYCVIRTENFGDVVQMAVARSPTPTPTAEELCCVVRKRVILNLAAQLSFCCLKKIRSMSAPTFWKIHVKALKQNCSREKPWAWL